MDWIRHPGTSAGCLKLLSRIPQQPVMLLYFSCCRNSQLFEEGGRGAAGPVISHSWLTVMTDFFLAPERPHLNHFTHSLLLIHTTDYQKTKLCEQRVSQKFIQEKECYCEINRSTQLRGSGRLPGDCSYTDALIHSDTELYQAEIELSGLGLLVLLNCSLITL